MSTTPDPRKQLIAEIQALINEAKEVWPEVAIVLLTLLSSMAIGRVRELTEVACNFAESEIERIKAMPCDLK